MIFKSKVCASKLRIDRFAVHSASNNTLSFCSYFQPKVGKFLTHPAVEIGIKPEDGSQLESSYYKRELDGF